MKITLLKLIFFSSFILLTSCQKEEDKSSLSDSLTYETVKYYQKSSGCDSLQNENCAEIKIEFPEVSFPLNKVVEQKINSSIVALFSQDILGAAESINFDSLMNGFIRDYESFKQEFPDAPQSWVIERSGKVKLNKAGIFSVDYTEYAYTGGAHPNTFVTFKNFNLTNGEEIFLQDLFSSEKLNELTKIAEQEFRKVKQLSPEDDLGKAGFWFENNDFSLTENFLILDTGLLFYYNNYEITAYAFGPTELNISYEKIKPLIDENSMLADFVE